MSPESRSRARRARHRGRRIAKYVAGLSGTRTPDGAVSELVHALKVLASASANPMGTLRRARDLVDEAIATIPDNLFSRGAS